MSNVTSEPSVGGGTSDEFEALANFNESFLGTGYSSSVEISFIVMTLIIGYVTIGTVRYLRPETRFLGSVVDVLGLRGD
jgi:hypothetical protein